MEDYGVVTEHHSYVTDYMHRSQSLYEVNMGMNIVKLCQYTFQFIFSDFIICQCSCGEY